MGNPTVADAILARLVNKAHNIQLKGEAMRKVQGDKNRRSNPPNHEGKFNNTQEVYVARNGGPYRSESAVHMVGTRPILVSNDAVGIVTVIGLH